MTESPGEKTFEVQLTQAGDGRLRAWLQILDRHDGSFLVLFRAYESPEQVLVNVLYKGKHVAQSPYTLKGIVQ